MQISPAVPAATGFSSSSTTVIRARPTGRPTGTVTISGWSAGGSPAPTSNRAEVMEVSVSPYAFSSRAQGAARSAVRQTSGSAGSPPVIISRTLRSRSSAGSVRASSWCQ
jgi:hypothetical protein